MYGFLVIYIILSRLSNLSPADVLRRKASSSSRPNLAVFDWPEWRANSYWSRPRILSAVAGSPPDMFRKPPLASTSRISSSCTRALSPSQPPPLLRPRPPQHLHHLPRHLWYRSGCSSPVLSIYGTGSPLSSVTVSFSKKSRSRRSDAISFLATKMAKCDSMASQGRIKPVWGPKLEKNSNSEFLQWKFRIWK